mmetsp:Transcript_14160/g.30773  ORF Transcript_14160/g.30773 Transcript_14160/m.30773 type:complete len:418 (+) Transcript_14160:228-1481(+)|eukprot:CAMPEP_0172315110 /NCGR_PEP_ID=MMETSP1058-20130122/24118_1 /TAXON_ID=83371 /ORGANISM="Detonula confervacea, Strain CCMP 353" /LENGTH=417 /DNA_ID=CAMNT_0013029115 /DNA_START=125 /DNA_END=1378 /DNA_ORIENTATION=+
MNDVESSSPPPPPKSMKEHTHKAYVFTVLIGLSMAFSAGYTNGVCLSGFIHVGEITTKQSVAGVTGLYTNSAIFIGEQDLDQAVFMFGTIFSVMMGAFLSSIMNPYPIAFEISPQYGPTFLLGSAFMMLGAISALHNNRREFYFTAIGNGIQNGVSSMYSANLLRTSHMTGTTTDIGLFVGMALRGNRTNNWKLYILIGLAISFWTGSIAGFFASQDKRQYSLIFNTAFFVAISLCVVFRTCRVYNVPVWQAMIGVGRWNTSLDHLEIIREDDGDVKNAVSIDELMKVFDDIDTDTTGKVDQHSLIEHLTSHHCKVQKKKKKIAAILHSAFILHGDEGDWKISREDWKHLIEESEVIERYVTERNLSRLSTGSALAGSTAVGPEALRRMSINQLHQSAGFRSSRKLITGSIIRKADT